MQFDQEQAQKYEQKHVKLQSMRDALHLTMRIVLCDQPQDSRVLCVGAGTGMELLALAQAFPSWRFTALDPSAAMLNRCRQHVSAAGFADRCEFFEGYLEEYISDGSQSGQYDIVTCILVSHFILDKNARTQLFRQMYNCMRAGGILLSADICADVPSASFAEVLHHWLNLQRHAGLTEEAVNNHKAALHEKLDLVAPEVVEALMRSAGFERPLRVFQLLMLQMWSACKCS